MKSTGLLFLGIAWILGSIVWFFIIESTMMGIIWLCGGTIELVIALIRRNREKNSNNKIEGVFMGQFFRNMTSIKHVFRGEKKCS